ncbi:hypothetical protein CJ197_00005 [Brachybacterium sp. UMB0905]|nr:hypothetical protein CJ197_00005 [Brachybacterium sp. UMB0905]
MDDINVQGKLVGKDGVFTGTVDFENVNVTGDLLASKISGEHLYGTVVEGGKIVTSDRGAGQVMLSDDGYVDPGNRETHSGIRVTPRDMSGLVSPPGLGPTPNGLVITGGRSSSGGRAFSIYSPVAVSMTYQKDGRRSDVIAWEDTAAISANPGGGALGQIMANPNSAHVKALAADGSSGAVVVNNSSATVETRAPGGGFMSLIRSNGREAYLRSEGSDGRGRVLSVDSGGVWVKVKRDDGSGYWDHYNLNPQQDPNPFSVPSGWVVDGSNDPQYTITLGVCHWDGVLKHTGTLSAGWTTIGYAPTKARPSKGDQLRALPTSSGRTVLGKIHASSGKIEVWIDQSAKGIYMHLSPFSYLVN